ncbi:MAG: FG-GAP-like repeat-containing protein [Terracidiphilus sp.]
MPCRVRAAIGLLSIVFLCSCSSSTPPISVQLSPSAAQTDQGGSVHIAATLTNDSSARGVLWSLNGPGSLTGQSTLSVNYLAPSNGLGVQNAIITATSVADTAKTSSVKITVNPLPFITTLFLPGASAGTAYNQTVGESGGSPPFTWSIAYGAVPNGISLDSGTGAVSGTPAEGGTWYFWVGLTDAAGATALQPFLSIEVQSSAAAGNPVPFLNQPVVPGAVSPGGPQFTLTANGTGFLPASTIHLNGAALATTFVNSRQLTAVVPAADIAKSETTSVTVVNPSPGGGSSNVVFLPVSTPEANVKFSAAKGSPIPVPATNYLAVGDFRGQGKPDLAVAQNGPSVSIYLANGDGTFTQAAGSPVEIPRAPWDTIADPLMAFVAIGDFNNSGKLGLALTDIDEDSVPILLGNGDGTFTTPTSFVSSGGGQPSSLATGDFLGNGNLDLAVANSPGGLDIVLGYGDGDFNQGPVSANGTLASAFMPAIGDFNQDGKLDIAVTDGGYSESANLVSILLGNGDGTFRAGPESTFATGSNPWQIVAADFNGDGILDLAIANYDDDTITILLGNGDGTFAPAPGSPVVVGRNPFGLAAADLNSDGKLDLVVANQTDSNLSILLGNGDGTFTPAPGSPLALGAIPFSIAVGDFNSSGRLGIAINSGDYVIVLVQQP